jgi:hypothetical protein
MQFDDYLIINLHFHFCVQEIKSSIDIGISDYRVNVNELK